MSLTLFQKDLAGAAVEYTYVTRREQLDDLMSTLWKAPTLAFDVEYSDDNPWYARLLLWQLSDGIHHYVGQQSRVQLHHLKPLLTSRPLLAHNAVAEYKASLLHGVDIKCFIDTMMEFLVAKAGFIEGKAKRSMGLAACCWNYLGLKLEGKNDIRKSFLGHDGEYFTKDQLDYAIGDVLPLHRLHDCLREELIDKGLYDIALFENSLIPTFGRMELAGMRVDVPAWREYIGGLDVERKRLLERIEQPLRHYYLKSLPPRPETGQLSLFSVGDVTETTDHIPFKVSSQKQLLAALQAMGLDVQDTKRDTFLDLIAESKNAGHKTLLEDLVALSEYTKLTSTYGELMLAHVNHEGRVWSHINQLGAAATGRASSSDPINFQNIPSRGERGEMFRSFFIAGSGRKLTIADYGALEKVISAHTSQDETMLRIFHEGLDMHGVSAAGIFGVPYEEFEEKGGWNREIGEYDNAKAVLSNGMTIKEMRNDYAKPCSFASDYGGDAKTIRKKLKKPLKQCEVIMTRYKGTFPRLTTYQEMQSHRAAMRGYTETIMGRKRFYYFTKWEQTERAREWFVQKRDDEIDVEAIKRQGQNHPTQGSAADVVKLAMQRIDREIEDRGLLKIFGPEGTYVGTDGPGGSICNQVHDEILGLSDECVAETFADIIQRNMLETEAELLPTVPPRASCHVGDRWSDK